jgi:hypothetical protein
VSTRRRSDSPRTVALRPASQPRRRSDEVPHTVALRPVELNALLQASAAHGGDADTERPTVQLLPLEPMELDPDPTPQPIFGRGSEPVRQARGSRRSREMLRVEDIQPGSGGRRRRPTR